MFTVTVDGRHLRKLTDVAGNAYNPHWSPDGRQITFARHRRLSPTGDVYTMRADGTGMRRLTTTPQLDTHQPDWGPA